MLRVRPEDEAPNNLEFNLKLLPARVQSLGKVQLLVTALKSPIPSNVRPTGDQAQKKNLWRCFVQTITVFAAAVDTKKLNNESQSGGKNWL